MIKSKYITFVKTEWTGKTHVVAIISKSSGYPIGQIKWYAQWRQYCFFPATDTVFNPDCLADINWQIKELMAERRGK